jgi:hypothetical protein
VRVFNLTDVPTPTLVGCGLVNTAVQVGGRSIPPGGSENVEKLSADDQRFLRCGAISIDEPPPAYRAARAVRPAPIVPDTLVEVEVKAEEETTEEETTEEPEPEEETEEEASEPAPEKRSRRGYRGRKKG